MGANSRQGWALLLFILGFTFLPAGLFALGPIFAIAGLAMLLASFAWFVKIKPLEHANAPKKPEPVSVATKAKQAAFSASH
jgi:membrane-bound ClpP family serine protease